MLNALRIILYWANFVLVVLTILSILKTRKSPSASLAWILAILVLPVVGLVAYLLAGMDWKKFKIVNRIPEEVFSDYLSSTLEAQQKLIDELAHSDDSRNRRAARNIRLLNVAASAPVAGGNTLTSYFYGEAKFEALLADIAAARESIHMEYYIWRSDGLGRKILEVLAQKASEGVTVRLLFDGWGSFGKISYSYRRDLKAAGIEFAYFLDLANPLARLKINYRNHRKIAVIDGRIGYVGGMNVGEEYVTGGKRFPEWRDTHLRIEGPAVSLLQAVFLVDWHNSGKELLLDESMFPRIGLLEEKPGIPVQIAISGPDSRWDGIRLHYIELLSGAKEEILIQTPYYIPGEALEQAMIAAALRGVRVVMMTVGKPDKRIPYWAAQTYFTPLLEAGVEIYRYRAGFLHSKVFIQDRIIASVGTCNVDTRSFLLDYEINAVLYSREQAELHAQQFLKDLETCSQITQEDLKKLSQFAKLRNGLFRLLSPLM